MSKETMWCVMSVLIAVGSFCMGWLYCFVKHVESRIEEIYMRGYNQGKAHATVSAEIERAIPVVESFEPGGSWI